MGQQDIGESSKGQHSFFSFTGVIERVNAISVETKPHYRHGFANYARKNANDPRDLRAPTSPPHAQRKNVRTHDLA